MRDLYSVGVFRMGLIRFVIAGKFHLYAGRNAGTPVILPYEEYPRLRRIAETFVLEMVFLIAQQLTFVIPQANRFVIGRGCAQFRSC